MGKKGKKHQKNMAEKNRLENKQEKEAAIESDPMFEFDAPQCVDFTKIDEMDKDTTADEWFEKRRPTDIGTDVVPDPTSLLEDEAMIEGEIEEGEIPPSQEVSPTVSLGDVHVEVQESVSPSNGETEETKEHGETEKEPVAEEVKPVEEEEKPVEEDVKPMQEEVQEIVKPAHSEVEPLNPATVTATVKAGPTRKRKSSEFEATFATPGPVTRAVSAATYDGVKTRSGRMSVGSSVGQASPASSVASVASNRSIRRFKSGAATTVKKLTQPKPFSFAVDQRAVYRRMMNGDSSAPPQTPREAPRTVKRQKLTVPQTPKFMTENRTRTQPRMTPAQQPKTPSAFHKEDGLTKPITPRFASDRRVRGVYDNETSEEKQIRLAREEAQRLAKKRVRARTVTMHKSLAGASSVKGTRSVKHLTQPSTPKFRSDSRMRTRAAPEEEAAPTPKTVRKTTSGPTQPKTPKFNTDARIKYRKSYMPQETPKAEPYVSLASTVNAFQSKTPTRFRTRKANTGPELPAKTPKSLTAPKEPTFRSEARVGLRSNHWISHEEQVEEEMKNMPKFKARPLDRRVLDSKGDLGVPVVKKPELTIPTDVHLNTQARSGLRKRDDAEEEEFARVFKARKLNKKMLVSPAKTPSAKKKELTKPKSPALRTRSRSRASDVHSEASTEFKQFRARPIMIDNFEVQPSTKPLTQPQPFNLMSEERHNEFRQKFGEQLSQKEMDEKKAREFKARPLMIADPMIPHPSENPVTTPEPFALESERRHEEHQKRWEDQVHEELSIEKQQFGAFRARPIPKSFNSPFQAEKSTKPLTEISDFELNSDRRASLRSDFDQMRMEKEKEKEAMRKKQEEERAAEEAILIKNLRKEAQFKARPIPKNLNKVFKTKPSEKKLTTPHTPKLRTATRSFVNDENAVPAQ